MRSAAVRLIRSEYVGLVVFVVAVAGRTAALDSWWCLDDWGQLARAAGRLEGPPGWPARWLSLLLAPQDDATWTSSLLTAPDDAFVICEKDGGFQAWGTTYDALLYAAQLHLVTGNYQAAVDHLARAWSTQRTRRLQVPADDVLGFPATALARPAQAFDAWLGARVRDGRFTRVEFARYHEFLGEPGPRQEARGSL